MLTFEVFQALGSEARWKILQELLSGGTPQTVNEVAKNVGVSQATASRHLSTMREAKVLVVRTDAQRRIYSVPRWVEHLLTSVPVFYE